MNDRPHTPIPPPTTAAIPTSPTAVPITRASFRQWTRIPMRWSDQDSMGHVNNAVIATYFEQARIEAVTPIIARIAQADVDIVVARVAIDFRRELRYPGTVEIGTRLGQFGTRSFVLQSELFLGEKRIASCEATVVCFDTKTRASTEPSPELRAAIQAIG